MLDLRTRPNKVLLSAYDFLIDVGQKMRRRWTSRFSADDGIESSLIGRDWLADDLSQLLCTNEPHGILSLSGHATHYEVGHPSPSGVYDIQGVNTEDLIGCEIPSSLVYTVGCHSGLSVDDATSRGQEDHPLDMPQIMLQNGALAFLGNTGYGWGLRRGVGYSERLVELFTQELTRQSSAVIGEAIFRAKDRYFLSGGQARALR